MTFKLLLAKAVHYVCYAAVWGVATCMIGVVLIGYLAMWKNILAMVVCLLGLFVLLSIWSWASDVISKGSRSSGADW